MEIIVFGTRGIPNVTGGVETHCEMLYPSMLKNKSMKITVICRSPYVGNNSSRNYKGVNLKVLYSPKSKTFEAIVHSILSAIYAIFKRPDLVHIHAVGPSLVIPMLRLFGIKVVMTHHGPDYERQKWGKAAKWFLKLGEWCGVKFSNAVIVISKQIASHILDLYDRSDSALIPNGVREPVPSEESDCLLKYEVEKNKYILALGRFVPEKGFDY